jgi:hypothetical protein
MLKLFWSWQSDCPRSTNKDFVRSALEEAARTVADDLGLNEAERPDIDQDTQNEPGLVDIVAAIFKKIEAAAVFVGDITPIAKTTPVTKKSAPKLLPNPNVLIELGYAIKAIGPEHIILVANRAFGGRPEDLPFDLRHRRAPISYHLKPDADDAQRAAEKTKLVASLADALRINLGAALAKKDASADISLYSHRDGDPSIWLPATERIEYNDSVTHTSKTVAVLEGTRAYIRLTPKSWTSKPSRHQVLDAPDKVRLRPLGRLQNGDFGANALGTVTFGFSREADVTHTAAQWFDKTGELWTFDSLITDVNEHGRRFLGTYYVLKGWRAFLDRALDFFDHFGAGGAIRVEAGIVGLQEVHWPSDIGARGERAVEAQVTIDRTARDWRQEARITFIHSIYDRLSDAFARPRVSSDQFRQILKELR